MKRVTVFACNNVNNIPQHITTQPPWISVTSRADSGAMSFCPQRPNGKMVAIAHSLSLRDIKELTGEKLGIQVKNIYTPLGAIIEDAELLRDDDVLFVTSSERKQDDSGALGGPAGGGAPAGLGGPAGAEGPAGRGGPSGAGAPAGCGGGDWVRLNVGGKYFSTTRDTLVKDGCDSMLARMFDTSGEYGTTWTSRQDASGAYLIDRSPEYFAPILNYLRHGELILDKHINVEGVLEEARFFGICSLIDLLEAKKEHDQPASDSTPVTRRELILSLMCTPSKCELRCQGLDFSYANLSRLDLRYINFKYAILTESNLVGANLSYCNFERADLSRAKLDGANLLGVKLLCANLEGASMKGCNFEDPAGSRASMEGANLKSVNLESSHMAGVNLRVATLRNANLQNCDLRAAVLAGADLENCDLSGCDLLEANLRGANLKGATFELMLNAVHMSQTIR